MEKARLFKPGFLRLNFVYYTPNGPFSGAVGKHFGLRLL